MDKQTFYAELTERLLKVGLSREYVQRHLAQFDSYFKGKNDDEVAAEIAKLGDLDKVAARIKRMTEKAINEAKAENESKQSTPSREDAIVNRDNEEIKSETPVTEASSDNVETTVSAFEETSDSDDNIEIEEDVVVYDKTESDEPIVNETDEDIRVVEPHGTKRGEIIQVEENSSITSAPIDPEIIEQNRKKFWMLFAATLPITLSIIAATAAGFALMFFGVAIVILISIGTLIFVTAAGTLVSVFGLIFGVSQMITSVPIGLYECGVAIMIGAFALAIGILVYNFAVRFMPLVAKWLIKFVHYVIRKYRELYVNLKKECIGL